MRTSNGKLFELEKIIDKYNGEKKYAKFAYMLGRNKTIISAPLKDFREVVSETPAMIEFNKERMKLVEKFADLDNDGKPKQTIDNRTGQPRFSVTRIGALSEAIKDLLENEHREAKLDQEDIERKTNELLREEIDIDFYCIPLHKIPGFRNEDDEDNGIIEASDLSTLLELGIIYEEEKIENVVKIKQA